jgi:quercetin dioxygenase-like cupin family protein
MHDLQESNAITDFCMENERRRKAMVNQRNVICLPAGAGTSIQMSPDESLLFKVVGEQTGGVLDCLEDTIAPKAGPPEHIHHQNDESFYILEGDFQIKIGDQVFKATPGTFCFVPRGIPHTWQNVGTGSGRMLAIFTPGGMEGFFQALSQVSSPLDNMAQVLPIVQKYSSEVVGPPLSQ